MVKLKILLIVLLELISVRYGLRNRLSTLALKKISGLRLEKWITSFLKQERLRPIMEAT
jgi:hypothetical protein